jgi:GNAT acetyltransferase-like protein
VTAPADARLLPQADHERWDRFVARSRTGSAYSTAGYLDALCEATGGRYRVLAVERGTEILGGIALYEEPSRLGLRVSPRRLLYYNGVVLRDHDTKYPSERTARDVETLSALEEALAALGLAGLRFKSRSPFTDARVFLTRGWTAELIYTYVVSFADLPSAWGRVEQNLRRLVERCSKQGVAMTIDDDFDSFYRLHEQTHERKGAPLYLPRAAFQRYFERLRSRDLCGLFHARLPDGRSIAAQLVLLGAHPVTHTVCAAADADHLKLGASAFLRWKVFEELSRRGYAANDLTDASLNPVTHFKSQLGGTLETCLELSLARRKNEPIARLLSTLRRRSGAVLAAFQGNGSRPASRDHARDPSRDQ